MTCPAVSAGVARTSPVQTEEGQRRNSKEHVYLLPRGTVEEKSYFLPIGAEKLALQ